MAISIDPLTRVIFVPQADLTLIEDNNYEMDTAAFRLELKDLEDDPFLGIYLQDTHNHTPPVTLSGSTYARFIEIINGYTIEWEDGQYTVSLKGANTNFVDVKVQNQVSVIANNSSGLIESDLIEFAQYQNQVTINTITGSGGTTFPIGTPTDPVSNLADALTIATTRGINKLFFTSAYNFVSGDNISFYMVEGVNAAIAQLTFDSGSVTTGVEFKNCTLDGYLGAVAEINVCHLETIIGESNASGVTMNIHGSIFDGSITLSSGLSGQIDLLSCKSGVAGTDTPLFDANGADVDIVVRDWTGGMEIRNFSNNAGQVGSIDITSGQVIVDSTCTDGTLTLRGQAKLTDNSAGTTVNSDNLITGDATTGLSRLVASNIITG